MRLLLTVLFLLGAGFSQDSYSQAFGRNHVLDFAKGKSRHISAVRKVTFNKKDRNFRVTLTITNHKVAGYVVVNEYLGDGVVLEHVKHGPCLKTESENGVTFSWISIKKGQSVTLTYFVSTKGNKNPSGAISGGILYHLRKDMPSTGPFVASPKYLPLKARPTKVFDETGREIEGS